MSEGDLGPVDDETPVAEEAQACGSDSDGAWSEGSRSGNTKLSPLPSGKYVLRTTASFDLGKNQPRSFNVKLTHDSPNGSWFCFAFILLLLGPAWALFRSHGFETRRWAESNFGD